MPIVGQGGTVTVSATVLNGAGALADPDTLALTIEDPLGDPLPGFPVFIPPIVRDSLGQYHYDWDTEVDADLGSYLAIWQGVVLGGSVFGQEQVEVVLPGSIVTGPLTFIQPPDDYNAIRALLGVTETDLADETIEMAPFGPHAEVLLGQAVTDIADLTPGDDPERWQLLKMATQYATAALLAESNAKGGYLGLVRGEGQRSASDWSNIATLFWGYYARLMQSGNEPDGGILYLLPTVLLSGPTRSRERARGPWAYITGEPDFGDI